MINKNTQQKHHPEKNKQKKQVTVPSLPCHHALIRSQKFPNEDPPLQDPLHLSNEYVALAIIQPNPHVHHYYKRCIHVEGHDVVHIHWLS